MVCRWTAEHRQKRFGVADEIVHCIAAHHEEITPESIESLIVICADAISGSRPGARRESAEQYIKRLEALEAILRKSSETPRQRSQDVLVIYLTFSSLCS